MESSLLELSRLLVEKQYISVDYIMAKCHISRRQFFYRLDKLNNVLKEGGSQPVEIGVSGELTVTAETKRKMSTLLESKGKEEDYLMSPKERQQYIYLMLFLNLEYLPLGDFVTYLQCGRTTVLSDLKELGQDLNQYDVGISNSRKKGYFLTGSEAQIRLYLMKRIIYILTEDGNTRILNQIIRDFNLDEYSRVKQIVKDLAKKHDIYFVENRLKEFIYIFIFLRERLTNSKMEVFETEKSLSNWDNITRLKEYTFTLELLEEFERKQEFSQYDIHYVSAWVLGISFGKYQDETSDREIIANIVKDIMSRFEALSGVNYEKPQDIFMKLYSHIRPAYYRMLFKIPIQNPVSGVVKEEYSNLYRLVKETMKPLAAVFGGELPEEELAFLTMHYAIIYSGAHKKKAIEKKVALIVCNNGIGSSYILYSELLTLFPDIHFLHPVDSSKVNSVEEKFDIIFTTTHVTDIENKDIPIIKVPPIIPPEERYQVIREVYSYYGDNYCQQPNIEAIINIVRQYCVINDEQQLYSDLATYLTDFSITPERDEQSSLNLRDVIKEDYILVDIQASDPSEAISKAYAPLLQDKAVLPAYVDSITSSISKFAPQFIITKDIALPHSKPEAGALKIAIGIARLKEPVCFDAEKNRKIKYLFCLSALNNHAHLKAMSQLADLFEDEAFLNVLEAAETPGDIYLYLQAKQF